jgi:hypothetical protein
VKKTKLATINDDLSFKKIHRGDEEMAEKLYLAGGYDTKTGRFKPLSALSAGTSMEVAKV